MTDRRSVLRGLLLLALMGRRAQAAPPSFLVPHDAGEGRGGPALVHDGERALMRGDADGAVQAFELATSTGHAHASELGLVRAAMQAGRYRQAMAFAAHTAAEHAQEADCVAAYVWLLQLGGQSEMARRVVEAGLRLAGTEARSSSHDHDHDHDHHHDTPSSQSLDSAAQAWHRSWPVATGALRQQPLRLAPYAFGDRIAPHARLVGSGLLCGGADGAMRVIGPAAACHPTHAAQGTSWWVRNGLGHTVRARLESRCEGVDAGGDVAVWQVDAPPWSAAACVLPGRDAFPGSPAYAFSYAMPGDGFDMGKQIEAATAAEAAQAPAAWPLMRMGFAGRVDARHGPLLGIDTPSGPWSEGGPAHAGVNPLGGPVFNAQGQVIGIALAARHPGGPDRLWPASAMRALPWWAEQARQGQQARSGDPGAPPRMPIDEIYERALRSCIQILAAT